MWRSRLPGLRTQLIISFVLVALLATLLVAFSAVVLRRQALLDQVTSDALAALHDDLLLAGSWVNERGETVVSDGFSRRLLPGEDLAQLGATLTPEDGTDVLIAEPGWDSSYRSRPDLRPELVTDGVRSIVAQGLIGEARVRGPDGMVLVVGGRVASDALAVYRIVDLEPVDADLAAMWRTLALAGAVPVVSALLIGSLAAGRLLRPVRRARDAAKRLGAGDLDTRLPVRGDDELAELSGSFNEMAGSLQHLVEELREMEARQRQFVADVSHELRTPLTALVAAVEVLEDELAGEGDGAARVPDDRRKATLLAIDEVRGMRGLVEDLMEITRFDAGRAHLDARPTRIAEAIASTLRRRGHADAVRVLVDPDLTARLDPRRLDTITANLVGNALAHGVPPVEVRAVAHGQVLVVDVVDAGPGVPERIRDHLFERFTKADQARTRAGGSGLGLAIARENARLHGGEVALVATGPTGTTMRLTVPGSVLPPGVRPADAAPGDAAPGDGAPADAAPTAPGAATATGAATAVGGATAAGAATASSASDAEVAR